MTRVLLASVLCACMALEAAPPSGYYDSAQGKTGGALRQALHAIINDHQVVRYASTTTASDTRDALEALDGDPANTNNVILIYSGWSEPKTNFGLIDGWNREHLWPESYGTDGTDATTYPAHSDLFNLRPCNGKVNSSRGQKYYDFSDPLDRNYKRSAHTNAPLSSTDTDSWEPPDWMKGDIARAIFYMDVRYEGDRLNEPDLILIDDPAQITRNTNNYMGRLSALLNWNQSDPVDGAEQIRNDLIFAQYQHNRNPFVDHPEWAEALFRPRLYINRGTNTITLRWDTQWTNATVEEAREIAASWSPVTNKPVIFEGQLAIDVSATNSSTFYRLRPR